MKEESELLETSILDKNESSLNHFVKNVVICRKKLKVLAFYFLKDTTKIKKITHFNNTQKI